MSEPLTKPAGARAPAILRAQRLCGFGRRDAAQAHVLRPRTRDELEQALRDLPTAGAGRIARGAGCAYGDAAQRSGGQVVDMRGVSGLLALEDGAATALAGTTLGELLRGLEPFGWTLPVVPGTSRVTVGGAIAADIHGKNHHVDGSFGDHVLGLRLLRADGRVLELAPGDEAFAATVGGMGLTGVVLDATLRLSPLECALAVVDHHRTADLEETLAILSGDPRRYHVAWVDALASPRWRAVVSCADRAPAQARDARLLARGTRRLGNARTLPGAAGALLRPALVRAHNELRYRAAPRSSRERVESLWSHLFPLDGLRDWNLLYGRDGLVQYQFAVPHGAESFLSLVRDRLVAARVPVYLAVLKRFGPGADRPLSFPIAGWTLAIDLPGAAAERHETLLRELDEELAAAGGRINLAKDSRLRADAFAAMYPQLDRFERQRAALDPGGVMRSDLGRRVGLCA